MELSIKLSTGAMERMFNGEDVPTPVLQVLRFKSIQEGRHRLFLSDGVHKSGSVMIASQLNHFITESILDMNCVVRIDKYVCNNVNDAKKVLVIFEMEIISPGAIVKGIIGNPVNFGGSDPQTEMDKKTTAPARATAIAANYANMPTENQTVQPNVHPISSLNPYQNKWTICARVTSKSSIRKWSNSKGEGHLFSFDLLDQSGEIKATAFKEQCDKFYNMIELNKIYYVSQAQIKSANKQFSSLKNDYEMTLSSQSQISSCHEEKINIPAMIFEFVTLNCLEKVEKDKVIDVIGVCVLTEELATINRRNSGEEIKKRDIQLMDNTGFSVKLALWGSQAENFDGSLHPIIAIKAAKVSDFNGKSLTSLSSSTLNINPDIKEAHKLRAWYENGGCSMEAVNLSNQRFGGSVMMSNFKTLGEAIQDKLGVQEVDYYSTKAIISLIRKENCMYPACSADGCNKKVIDMNNGQYRCEKCNREYDTFKWRLMLSASIADGTDNVWVTAFQDQAEALLSCTSANLGALKEKESDSFHAIFQEASFKEFIFKLRVKMETYNEESRLKTSVISVQPLDFKEYNTKLIAEIKAMTNVA